MLKSALRAMVINASDVIAPVWPMKTIIACNPLQGMENVSFQEAVQKGNSLFEGQGYLKGVVHDGQCSKDIYLLTDLFPDDGATKMVNEQLIKWLCPFLDEGQANITMPDRHEGFYKSFKQMVLFDEQIHKNYPKSIQWLEGLPPESVDALEYALIKSGKAQDRWEEYLRLSLVKLNGWSGFIKWRSSNNDYKSQQSAPVSLIDYLAVRLCIECSISMFLLKIDEVDDTPIMRHLITRYDLKRMRQLAGGSSKHPHEGMDYLVASEESYRLPLLQSLKAKARILKSSKTVVRRPKAQFVFCIDVRSEQFRRSIEQLGDYKTYGFAGFFGLPIRVHAFANHDSCDSCPVLLKPRHDVYEAPVSQENNRIEQYYQGEATLNYFKSLYNNLKFNVATPFALAEGFGPWCGLVMLARTIFPSQFIELKSNVIKEIKPTIKTNPAINMQTNSVKLDGISFTEQALYAEAFLRMIGLTDNFAPIILLCGHGSKTENNPYASALDCGACGGNHGGANAKVMAAILNQGSIRKELAGRQIHIPEDTWFISAEHNTTTDELDLLEQEPPLHLDLMNLIKNDLTKAQDNNSCNRLKNFGIQDSHKSFSSLTQERSNDWACVRPEWGLARNAAFIVAPRELTESIDLEGRSFLHSYDWRQDESSKSLETILTAPMVVAQWINSQYYFSTVDNIAYGSGSKVTHNVVGKFGVMQGNASDLMHGLSLQSVYQTDTEAYHEPLRLMTVVYAPAQKVKALIDKHEVLQKLFYNEWVALRVIEPSTGEVYALKNNGEWANIKN